MAQLPQAAGRGRRRARVLVTGHHGYVGSILVEKLLGDGVDVVGVDARWFVSGTGRCWQDVDREELSQFDAVVHLGGFADDRSAAAAPELARTTITDDSVSFADRCRKSGVARFIFASSAAVYGSTTVPVDEASPTDPKSLYAAAKLDAERQVLALAEDGFAPVALRFGSGFGWSPSNRFDLVVNKMTLIALRDGTISSDSTGTSHRPFVHVRDMAGAAVHALDVEVGSDGHACFNVVHHKGNLTIGEVIDVVAAETGASVGPAGTVKDPRDYQMDGSALLGSGFECEWDLERGVAALAAHLRHRPVNDPSPWERRSAVERPSMLSSGWPLVSPSVLDADSREGYLTDVSKVTSTSRYRLDGGHTAEAARLVAGAFGVEADRRALLLRSGTDSLALALKLSGVGAGNRVAVPDHAFHAVAATVLNLGAVPLFVDVEPDDFNLSPTALEKALAAGGVTAVVAVDNYGTPSDWSALGDVCASAGVPLILDACESLGAGRPDGRAIDHADLIAVSFSFTKPVHAAGMGGALIGPIGCIDEAASDPRHLLRQTMLPELNAAYLVRAWPQLPANVARLRANYDRYRDALEPLGFTAQAEHGTSTRLHAPFLVPASGPWSRDAFLGALSAAGINAGAQFPSQSHLLGLDADCPTAGEIASRVVSMPSGAALAVDEVATIAATAVRTFSAGPR